MKQFLNNKKKNRKRIICKIVYAYYRNIKHINITVPVIWLGGRGRQAEGLQ